MTMLPTVHALPHAQRLCLMRLPRKLGALLGEMPLLFERRSGPASPTTAAFTSGHARSASTMSTESKRSGWLFIAAHALRSLSFALSTAPPAAQTNHAHAHLAPVAHLTLFLRLPPAASAASPAECTPLSSPLSPTFNINSPARRRATTLTSRVPEFVLKRRRGGSPVAVATAEEAAPRPSLDADEPFSFPSTVPFALPPEPRTSSDTSASGASGSSGASSEHLLPPADHGMHRREQGWSGEWRDRVDNMRDVVRSQRELQVK